jgi:hypothetical protein
MLLIYVIYSMDKIPQKYEVYTLLTHVSNFSIITQSFDNKREDIESIDLCSPFSTWKNQQILRRLWYSDIYLDHREAL